MYEQKEKVNIIDLQAPEGINMHKPNTGFKGFRTRSNRGSTNQIIVEYAVANAEGTELRRLTSPKINMGQLTNH